MAKYNILIVEDHALTRFGLKTAFESADCLAEIYEASKAQTGIDIVEKENIDVVIMDLGLPDMNGIEAAKIIKQKHPEIKVIILSSHEQQEDVIKSVKAGASAYCTKDVAPDKLISIVESAIKGAAWFDPKVAGYVLNAAYAYEKEDKNPPDTDAKQEKTADTNLTTREKQVLALIVEGFSNSDIAKKLDVSVNTTKAHVCNILQKLSVSDRTQAAIKAIKDHII